MQIGQLQMGMRVDQGGQDHCAAKVVGVRRRVRANACDRAAGDRYPTVTYRRVADWKNPVGTEGGHAAKKADLKVGPYCANRSAFP